jgi:hypothetical protein
MGFMNDLKQTLNENSFAYTENGALGFSTSGTKLLDINFAVTSFRNKSDKAIEDAFVKAFYENKLLAVKWMFLARDAREGIGERRLFRICLKWLATEQSEIAKAVFGLVPYYGRFDDMWCLLDTELRNDVIAYVSMQLDEDLENMKANKPVSLLGKWLPSMNASSRETKRLAKIIYTGLGMTERNYRKTLSALRKHLKVVEVQMSAKQWNEINYNAVPSRANLIYNGAFLRNDEERRRAYLAALERGDDGVKINANVLFPDEIVHKYGGGGWYGRLNSYDSTLEELWKALPTLSTENTLIVRDGSGSMSGKPLEVSTALAIYMAERNQGEFHNQFITFSSVPKIIDLNGLTTLHDKLAKTYREDDCSNTNIEAVFRLILKTAVKHNMTQEDMPKNIVIISDMHFDGSRFNCNDTLFGTIGKEYAKYGYQLPRLTFWNVNGNCSSNVVPVQQNNMGVVLMSGYSQNLIKMVMSNQTDPYKCLLEQLNSERYQIVEDAVKEII